MASPSLNVEILSETRVVPATSVQIPETVTLSIVDSSVARYTPSICVWFFDPPEHGLNDGLESSHLRRSLEQVLVHYAHFAGQLHWAPYTSGSGPKSPSERYQRVQTTFGRGDPGVHFVEARSPKAMAELLPDPSSPARRDVWNVKQHLVSEDLFPKTPKLALHDLRDYEGLPAVIVQATSFSDGGFALGVKIAHTLADAQALAKFVHDWAKMSQHVLRPSPAPLALSPLFDPCLLDSAAAGDINAASPDPQIIEQARKLPRHRYDRWSDDAADCPSFMLEEIKRPDAGDISEDDMRGAIESVDSVPAPWKEWDLLAPVEHLLVHFTEDEVNRIHRAASSEKKVSRLDALLAHIWECVIAARVACGINKVGEEVYLTYTLGLRARISPPLPTSFIGSPVALSRTSTTASTPGSAIGSVAASIRDTVSLFTPSAVASLLHFMHFTLSPNRIWNAFLGSRNLIVTTWVGLSLYDIDFSGRGEGKRKIRYVEGVMPKMDGLVQVMDAPSQDESIPNQHWSKNGVDVALYLKEEVGKYIASGEGKALLRRYRNHEA